MIKKNFVVLILFCAMFNGTLYAGETDSLVSQAENALIATDFNKVNSLIKEILKSDPSSSEALKLTVKLDVSTMQFGKMLFDYRELKKRIGADDDNMLLFASVSLLTKAINHENYFVRSAAAKAIGDMAHPKLAPMVMQLLNDEVQYVRFFAVETLGHFRDSRMLPLFANMLEVETDISVKMAIVKAIKKINTPKALQVLASLKENNDPGIRLIALGFLAAAGDNSSFEMLAGYAADNDNLTRAVAIKAMGQVSGNAPIKYFKAAAKDKDKGVRTYLAEALAKVQSEERYKLLAGMLADKNPEVRAAVVSSLAKYPASTLEMFSGLLNDPDKFVLIEVFKAIRLKGGRQADKGMAAMLKEDDYELRHSMLGRIAELGDESDTAFLLHALKDPVDRVRIAAVRALGRLRNKNSIEPLLAMLNDNNPIVQVYVAGNLGGVVTGTVPAGIDDRE